MAGDLLIDGLVDIGKNAKLHQISNELERLAVDVFGQFSDNDGWLECDDRGVSTGGIFWPGRVGGFVLDFFISGFFIGGFLSPFAAGGLANVVAQIDKAHFFTYIRLWFLRGLNGFSGFLGGGFSLSFHFTAGKVVGADGWFAFCFGFNFLKRFSSLFDRRFFFRSNDKDRAAVNGRFGLDRWFLGGFGIGRLQLLGNFNLEKFRGNLVQGTRRNSRILYAQFLGFFEHILALDAEVFGDFVDSYGHIG